MLNDLEGCDLIVIPELANSGYNFHSRNQALEASEEVPGGPFSDFILKKAREMETCIVAGVCEREGKSLFNTAIVAGPEGFIGKYRKLHLFMNEKDIFEPGHDRPAVYDLGGFRIGVQICFDYLFPEPWRMLAGGGADIICHPSNLITENAYRTLPAQALMNKVFIVTANRIGAERELQFCGRSVVHDPSGAVIFKASGDHEETGVTTFDTLLSKNKLITPRNHVFNDRREDIYH